MDSCSRRCQQRMICPESLLNVSIVEDDEAVGESLRNLLRSAGHRVELFASAEEFFAAAASARSHVVITDIQLGGTSGIEVTRRLKQPGSRVRVVVITASLDDKYRASAVGACADGDFVNPLAAGALLACVESLSFGPPDREGVAQAAGRVESIALRDVLDAEVLARQRAEEALRETHAAMIKHQQVGQMCDFRFNTVSGRSTSSPEGYKLFDFPPDLKVIEYEDWARQVHPEDGPRIGAGVAQAAAARHPMRFEYRIIRRGEIRHLSCDGQVDTEHDGDLTYYGVLADVTERKAVESALRDVQSKLASANRLASLGELAGSIVHEVNQPLTAIATHAEAGLRWLSHVPPNLSEARESLENVVTEATRAATVVKGLRNIARGGPAEFTTIDVNPIIDEVLILVRSSTERANVAVQLVLEKTLPPVKGNRTQVQQVVFNLVQNAIDALLPITDRQRRLTVLSKSDAAMRTIEIAVIDNGAGIDQASVGRIFEPLFTTRKGGLGLGLSICSNIVEAHGGHMVAALNADHGMIVRVTLPQASSKSSL